MIRAKLAALRANTLVANSFYLMLASGAVAAFGFVFWAVVAHAFVDSEVGIAATILSLSSLISLLSLAGFDTTFIRFLPKSTRREDYVNSGLIIAGGLSVVLSLGFLVGFPLFAPNLAFVSHTPLYALAFVVFNVFTTLNTLTNAIFTAYRRAGYILGINVAFSALKVALPFVVVGGGAMAIFIISGIAQAAGVALSFWAMAAKFGHVFRLRIHRDIVALSKKYAFVVYCSSVLNLLPPTVLPLIITHEIGAEFTAYYYMAFTIATLLYTIAYASMQSVFAESSHAEEALRAHLKKAAKLLTVLLVPAMAVLAIVAPFILAVFGVNYARNGTLLLQLFAASALFVGLYSAAGMVFKVRHAMAALLAMNVAYTLVIIGVSYAAIAQLQLVGIGLAWLAGNVVAVGVGVVAYKLTRR